MVRGLASTVWAALLAAGAALHLWGISRKALWYDEITTAVYAAKSAGDLWQFLATREVHPPLFFFLSKAALALPLTPEWSLRLIPLLAALACIPLAEAVARHAWGVRWWGALLAAFFPGLVLYAQEARAYAPLAFTEFLVVYALVRIRAEPGARRWVVLAGAGMWLGAALHYFAVLFIVPASVAVFLWSDRKRFAVAALALGVVLYGPWIPVALNTFFGDPELLKHAQPRTLLPTDYFAVFAALWGGTWGAVLVLALCCAALIWAAGDSAGRLLLALFVFTPAFLTALPPTYPYFPARYVIAWAALPVLLIPSLLREDRAPAVRRGAAALVAVLALLGAWTAVKHARTPREWNRALAAGFKDYFNTGDVIVVSPFYQSLALEYYLPLEPTVKAELLEDPLKNYDGARVQVGGRPADGGRSVVIVSPEVLHVVMSNRRGLSGNLWLVQYGPLPAEMAAWNDVMTPIVRWPDATLYRITNKVIVDKRNMRMFLGPVSLGPYQPAPEQALP